MLCKKCGIQQPDQYSNCTECGTPLYKNQNTGYWNCDRCNAKQSNGLQFCTNCGNKKMQNSDQVTQTFTSFDNSVHQNQPPVQSQRPEPKKKRKKGKLALVLILCVIVLFFRGDLLNFANLFKDNQSTHISEGNLNLNSEEINIAPIDGVSIHVSENAMGVDKNIKVQEIEDSRLKEIAKQIPDEELLLIDAFEFDMGLNGKERIPGVLEINFSMDTFNIPEGLQDYIKIVRLHEGEPFEILASQRVDNILVAETQKNSVLGMVIIIPASIYTANEVRKVYEKDSAISKIREVSDIYDNEEFRHTYAYSAYKLYWPASMGEQNPTEVARVSKGIESIRKKYGLDDRNVFIDKTESKGYRGDILSLIDMLGKDTEYLELAVEINSFEWQQKNWWPTEVVDIYKRLSIVDSYLFETRSFQKPKNAMHIYLLPYGYEDDGEVVNPVFDRAYMFLNIKGINDINIDKAVLKGVTKSIENYERNLEILTVVMTHEIFHMSEISYVLHDYNGYVWVWEALATLLEKECYVDYVDMGVIKSKGRNNIEFLTEGNQTEWFSVPLGRFSEWPETFQDANYLTRQGYASSPFLMELKTDKYGASDRMYIKKILNNLKIKSYVSGESGGINSVIEESVKTEEEFNNKFKTYFQNQEKGHFNRLYLSGNANSTMSKMLKYEIRLSEQVSNLGIENTAYASLFKEVKAAFNANLLSINDFKIALIAPKEIHEDFTIRYKESKNSEFKSLSNSIILEDQKQNPFYIHEIHSYRADNEIEIEENGYKVAMLVKPKASELEVEDKKLIVNLPQKSTAVEEGIIKKYHLKVWNSFKESVEVDIDANDNSFEISLDGVGKFGDIKSSNEQIINTAPNLTKEYLEKNPNEKKKLIDQYGSEALDKMVRDNLIGTLDTDSMFRAIEVLKGGSKKWYVATVTEILDRERGLFGVEGEISQFDVGNEKMSSPNLVGTWKGKDELTRISISVTISPGTNGFDYNLENSLYGSEVLFSGYMESQGVYQFVMVEMEGIEIIKNASEAKSDATALQAYTITVNSENEIYMLGGPTGKLNRQ